MKAFHLRTDLERSTLGGFTLPLGLDFEGVPAPNEGYTVTFRAGEDEEPDMYAFDVVVSHDRLRDVLIRAFTLLPDQVVAVLEIGSRDAYRMIDVWMSREPLDRCEFLGVWEDYDEFLLEDCSILTGAVSESPAVEVLLDQWKGIAIHVTPDRRDEVVDLLAQLNLHEVQQTWPELPETDECCTVRGVLDVHDEFDPDIDDVVLELRQGWGLGLHTEPARNLDDGGRDLGYTLWHIIVLAADRFDSEKGAYLQFWLTANCLEQAFDLVREALDKHDRLEYVDYLVADRIAFDERPDALVDIPHRRQSAEMHDISYDPW